MGQIQNTAPLARTVPEKLRKESPGKDSQDHSLRTSPAENLQKAPEENPQHSLHTHRPRASGTTDKQGVSAESDQLLRATRLLRGSRDCEVRQVPGTVRVRTERKGRKRAR